MQPDRAEDLRWLAAAAALGARGWPASRPNPAVGAIIVDSGKVVARGWTQPGGRPHAEAVALAAAADRARGATLYVSLEPCAHASARGPACAEVIAASGLARVVAGCADPDPRTAGKGLAGIAAAGIGSEMATSPEAEDSLGGYLLRRGADRPRITLKLATSLNGCIALADGTSRWITGEPARAHAHALRARMDAVVVGSGTLRADSPRLDVRLPGLESHVPRRVLLTHGTAPEGWTALPDPARIGAVLPEACEVLVEGGAQAAAAFLSADLVDRLFLYRAPLLIGGGRAALGEIGLADLAGAHGRWRLCDRRQLGSDSLEVYQRTR